MIDLKKIYLFRMTHLENIPHILKKGITHISSPNNNPEYKSIGDGGLISNRAAFDLPNGKKLGDYIPFYFGGRMPMLYVIQKGYNGVIAIRPENIVYCVTSISLIQEHKLNFVFTNGHAVDSFSELFYPNDVMNIHNIVDFKAVTAQYWKNEGDLDLKRRKEAEFLVENDIPPSAIGIFIVYNENAKQRLLQMGVEENKVKVKNAYYF